MNNKCGYCDEEYSLHPDYWCPECRGRRIGIVEERARVSALLDAEKLNAEKFIKWFESLPGPQQYTYEDDAAGCKSIIRVMDNLLDEIPLLDVDSD